jgi:hypothetical protein
MPRLEGDVFRFGTAIGHLSLVLNLRFVVIDTAMRLAPSAKLGRGQEGRAFHE